MSNKLELRMYGLVPYNISPIQQAIQFGHAVVEYGQKMKYLGEHKQSLNTQYNDWADNWKTFIILNGGTTNHKTSLENGLPFGSLNNHLLTLSENDVELAHFSEPDLGDQLTAVVFIVDERVFNKKKYPDFGFDYDEINDCFVRNTNFGLKPDSAWKESIGGAKNVFLRDFLKNFRLA
jgi:hypothetical protein